jgi:hypothetical protein
LQVGIIKADLIKQNDWVKQAYASGVPMGRRLCLQHSNKRKTKFLVQAVKEPNAANLDRYRIIKVSTKKVMSTEKILTWFGSGDRKLDAANGNLLRLAKR